MPQGIRTGFGIRPTYSIKAWRICHVTCCVNNFPASLKSRHLETLNVVQACTSPVLATCVSSSTSCSITERYRSAKARTSGSYAWHISSTAFRRAFLLREDNWRMHRLIPEAWVNFCIYTYHTNGIEVFSSWSDLTSESLAGLRYCPNVHKKANRCRFVVTKRREFGPSGFEYQNGHRCIQKYTLERRIGFCGRKLCALR